MVAVNPRVIIHFLVEMSANHYFSESCYPTLRQVTDLSQDLQGSNPYKPLISITRSLSSHCFNRLTIF
jgi:hypothetical protein